MGKVTDMGLAPPDDPMYSEGPQRYSPHGAQGFLRSKKTSPATTDGDPDPAPASGKAQPAKDDNRGEPGS
jgi:hypothetical protein